MRRQLILVATFGLTSAHAYDPAGTPDDWPAPMHEPGPYWTVLADRFELGFADNADTYAWDVQGWYGGDKRRVWFKSEGEGDQGESPESTEIQVLYGKLIAPFWDVQFGLRHDLRPKPERTYAVAGLQGSAPYKVEIDAAAFLSDEGDLSARVEVEYDVSLTQRLVLQPRFEVNAAASDDEAIGRGDGITTTELGLRLRYEFEREIAPYIGIEWEQSYGDTRDLARAAGEATSLFSFVAGLRFWF